MRLLWLIWKDILWLNSRLHPAVKVTGLIIGIALIIRAWYLGAEWWMTTVNFGHWGARSGTRLEQWTVPLVALFGAYIVWVIVRDRKSG